MVMEMVGIVLYLQYFHINTTGSDEEDRDREAMVDFWECGLIFQRLKSESVSVNVFHLLFADEKERGRERERWW